jgi:hypothetical protein
VIAALFILYFLRTPIEGAAQTLVSAIFG